MTAIAEPVGHELTGVPTTKEEIERKVFEFLELMAARHATGRINDYELSLVGHTLWTSCAGLIDEELLDACSEAAKTARAPERKSRHFVSPKAIVSFYWLAEKAGYLRVVRKFPDLSVKEAATGGACEPDQRPAVIAALIEKLKPFGFSEI